MLLIVPSTWQDVFLAVTSPYECVPISGLRKCVQFTFSACCSEAYYPKLRVASRKVMRCTRILPTVLYWITYQSSFKILLKDSNVKSVIKWLFYAITCLYFRCTTSKKFWFVPSEKTSLCLVVELVFLGTSKSLKISSQCVQFQLV